MPDNTAGYPSDIFQWLDGCPVVLTGASTVAVEAMLMDVPVVTMDFCDEIHGVDFIDAGATMHVRTGNALVEAVGQVLAGRAPDEQAQARVRTYLEASFCALDGRSASRGARALVEQFGDGVAESSARRRIAIIDHGTQHSSRKDVNPCAGW